jgi:murein DD-endopeptidase MepM/ murein hydrolase activator NlpD
LALAAPGSAGAATGGVSAPAAGTGGVVAGTVPLPAKLSVFSLSSKRLRAGGAPVKVRYRIDGGAKRVTASLRISSGGVVVRTVPLGNVRTGVRHVYSLVPDRSLPAGTLVLRIKATGLRSSARRKVVFTRPAPPAPPAPSPSPDPSPAPTGDAVFPLRGAFTYGDGFGVPRPGRTHKGVDLLAVQGTPIVSPRAGTITHVDYQAGGAGHYVVVSGAGEDLDYVFMHMAEGSVRVREGQTVRAGQQLGDVGSTGSSTAPHLHFEIWQGAWQAGGVAIDPVPFLKRWR